MLHGKLNSNNVALLIYSYIINYKLFICQIITMNSFKKNIPISIIPLVVLVWGIFIILFFDPFYSRSSDPEFPYLVNGLNCALLNFNRIGHIDHPGTPFQVFNGIVIRITHLISGKGDIAQDVFSRPEYYLNAISISLLLVLSLLIFEIGSVGFKKKIPLWQIMILQACCFYNDVIIWLFSRVNPDRFFILITLLYIFVYLKYGYKNRSSIKFAIWSGVVMALGLATKFNYLPLLILPLILLDTNKNRLVYTATVVVSFFIFIAPIIDKFGDFRHFITKIFNHDGIYGSGNANVFNFEKIIGNIREIFHINPELYLILIALVASITISYLKRKKEGVEKHTLLFADISLIIAFQILMVSKHFKNYYLLPLFTIYSLIFFLQSQFISIILKNKTGIILASCILPVLFAIINFNRVQRSFPFISKDIINREKILTFVDNKISKEDFWFIEPTWESGPHVENAIVYGMSYCRHREDYLTQLMAVNPNVITYEENKEQVNLWRCTPVSLDSVVSTGKNIYVYSTPGRNAPVLIQMLKDAASRNSIQLQIDTIYNDVETERRIIRAKGLNTSSTWQTKNVLSDNRKVKIQNFIIAIKIHPNG